MASCQSNSTTDAVAAAVAAQPAHASAEPANPEHVEMGILTVNGKPREHLSTLMLTSQLGRPDSVAKEIVECGGELEPVNNVNGDLWYYGKTQYEVAGTQAVLASFDVTTGKYQGRLGQLVLNQKTTLQDVRSVFPISTKEAEEASTGRPEVVMHLPFYEKGSPTDAALKLIFKQGHLQEVAFFNSC